MTRIRLLCGVAAVLGTLAGSAMAGSTNGTLYFTTFAGGVDVRKINYTYDGTSSFVLSGNTGIASNGGADGLLFAPNGNLLVANLGNGIVKEWTTGGAFVTQVPMGTGTYHLALSSTAPNATLFTMWNGPGGGGATPLAATVLSGGGLAVAGTPYTVVACPGCSGDVRGLIFNPANATWYYGTAPDGGTGDFGTVSFSGTTATLTRLLTGQPSHGLTYDPLTDTVIMSAGNNVAQFDPTTGTVVSTFAGPGGQEYDQSSVDGLGHLFLASNTGNLTFVDYSGSSLIGAGTNFSNTQFLASSLDDIAPLSGAGGTPVPAPASGGLLAIALAAMGVARRRR